MSWIERRYDDLELHVRVHSHSEYSIEYEVRKILSTDPVLLFEAPEGTSWKPTEDVEKGEIYIKGTIKWDGCSHNDFGDGGYIHGCERKHLTRLGILYDRLFDWAIELLGPYTNEFLK